MPFVAAILEELRRAPARLAVDDGRAHTCAELLARVAAHRAGLAARGVRPGDRVGLVAPGSADWIAIDLAVLASGCVLVPLDPRQDARERAACVRDADLALLVHPAGFDPDPPAHAFAPGPGPFVGPRPPGARTSASVTEAEDPPGARSAPKPDARRSGSERAARPRPRATIEELASVPGEPAAPPLPVDRRSPATILYTSGSSGEPKGAVLGRQSLAWMLEHVAGRLGKLTGRAKGEDRTLHLLPPCYAGSRVILLASLLRGAELHLVRDPKALGDALARVAPDHLLCVPLVLERIRRGMREGVAARGRVAGALLARCERAWERVEEGRARKRDRLLLAAARPLLLEPLKRRLGGRLVGLVCGSAPLAVDCQRFFRMLGVEVYQGYGLTETTALLTLDLEGQVRPGWVGPALPGVEMRLDPDGHIQTRGPGTFAGYWRRPLTESITRDGWFDTGDLGEVDAEGRWRILGRAGAVLALQTGHKVAPEPIEDALARALDGDAQVVVLGHGKPHLVALVCAPPLGGAAPARDAVQRAVDAWNRDAGAARRVHAFEVLSAPFSIDAGLLTPNLKVKRKAIAERFAAKVEALCASRPVPAAP